MGLGVLVALGALDGAEEMDPFPEKDPISRFNLDDVEGEVLAAEAGMICPRRAIAKTMILNVEKAFLQLFAFISVPFPRSGYLHRSQGITLCFAVQGARGKETESPTLQPVSLSARQGSWSGVPDEATNSGPGSMHLQMDERLICFNVLRARRFG